MSDEQNGVSNGNGVGGGHVDNPSIKVAGQYLKDLSFESPNAPKSLQSPGSNPNLQVDIHVNANKLEGEIFESAIHFKAHASNDEGTIYLLEAVYAGAFEVKNIPGEALEPLMLINCPAILYPFLRRLVSDVTQEGGFPPLLLDPIDFAALYQKRQEGKSKEADA